FSHCPPAVGMDWHSVGGFASKNRDGSVSVSREPLGESWKRLSDPTIDDRVKFTSQPVSWSLDGRLLATSLLETGGIALWDVPSGRKVREIGVKGGIGFFSFVGLFATKVLTWSPDGRLLVSRGHRQLGVWDVETGQLVQSVPAYGLGGKGEEDIQSCTW